MSGLRVGWLCGQREAHHWEDESGLSLVTLVASPGLADEVHMMDTRRQKAYVTTAFFFFSSHIFVFDSSTLFVFLPAALSKRLVRFFFPSLPAISFSLLRIVARCLSFGN